MLSLGGNTQLPQFRVHVMHECGHPLVQRTEIMILHFLPPRRRSPEQCPAGHHQIQTFFEEMTIHQEIFLLGPQCRIDPLNTCLA